MLSDKKLILLIFILLIILIVPMYVLSQKESGEEKLLHEQGVETFATVLNVHYSKTTKRSSRNYYMDVAFFSLDSNQSNSKKVESPTSSQHPVDVILSKMKLDVSPSANYSTATIPIQGITAGKYKKNDKVKIIYLPKNPQVLRLKEEI